MTTEQKNILIAEKMGWTVIHDPFIKCDAITIKRCYTKEAVEKWRRAYPRGTPLTSKLPSYFTDLNACHEAESSKGLHYDQSWIETLTNICLRDAALSLEKTDGWDWALLCVRATAAQRAEAIGVVLKLWEAGE